MNANALNSLQIIPGLSWKRTAKSSERFVKGEKYVVLRTNAALNVSQLGLWNSGWIPSEIVSTERLFSEFSLVRPNIRIYDNGGATADRYTCVFMDEPENDNCFMCLAMSEDPFHPCGIGMHCSGMPGRHLGKRIKFEDLSKECQNCIVNHFEPEL